MVVYQVVVVAAQNMSSSCTTIYKMAYPPSYYPIKNYTMFNIGNWRWAAPGDDGNRCERCGTHCFCAAEKGQLPRTRNSGQRAAAAAASAAAAAAAVAEAIEHVEVAIADDAVVQQDGIAAILMYDSDVMLNDGDE